MEMGLLIVSNVIDLKVLAGPYGLSGIVIMRPLFMLMALYCLNNWLNIRETLSSRAVGFRPTF